MIGYMKLFCRLCELSAGRAHGATVCLLWGLTVELQLRRRKHPQILSGMRDLTLLVGLKCPQETPLCEISFLYLTMVVFCVAHEQPTAVPALAPLRARELA